MAMQTFTGWQYLLIDAANAYGLDKDTFDVRIQYIESNLDDLEALADKADNKALYLKAVQAIRKAQKGIPTGHLVGLDGVCSGMQIMSAITGCEAGGRATGLIDTGKRPDAYTEVTQTMNQMLPSGIEVQRDRAKRATMTSLYGSKAEPKKLFGEDTPELHAFYEAMTTVAPGAWTLLHVLMDSWQVNALSHEWKLPDGFDARIKVMQQCEVRIEVDELDHSTFTYYYDENIGSEKGISLAANVVHSIDAYVLRSVHRRCNYDREVIENVDTLLSIANTHRHLGGNTDAHPIQDPKVGYYVDLWEQSGMVDAAILPHLNAYNVLQLPQEMLRGLLKLTSSMLAYQPFEVVAIHDEFKCGPNHMNHLRKVYTDVLAELAESKILDWILSTIRKEECIFQKGSTTLAQQIRQSNYALC